jgi:hypothetical protein
MGASHSVERMPALDLEAPEIEEEVVIDYNKEYEEVDTLDTLFLYWWS